MNYSLAVFLINKNARAVRAIYEADAPGNTVKRSLFKTFDPSLAVDDLVIVPTDTRHKFTVVKIVETDIDLDFDTTENVQWIVGRLDLANHATRLQQEQAAIAAIKQAELKKKRDELSKALFADYSENLKALPIAQGDTTITPAAE
mgnify:CR=1 FL=1